MPGPDVTADELWSWILDNREIVDGRPMCRRPIWDYLEERGVPAGSGRVRMRTRLVKELEAEGRVERPHPRSIRLHIITDLGPAPLDVSKRSVRTAGARRDRQ